MKTLIFITIIFTILLLIPHVFPLTANEIVTLKDMYNQWGKIFKWTPDVINACNNWNGITCANGNVVRMFVKFKFVNFVKLIFY